MPPRHVLGVGLQLGAPAVMLVAVVQVDMMGLAHPAGVAGRPAALSALRRATVDVGSEIGLHTFISVIEIAGSIWMKEQ